MMQASHGHARSCEGAGRPPALLLDRGRPPSGLEDTMIEAGQHGGRDDLLASGGVERDAKKLLRVLAGKDGAREGRPVPAGPGDAAAGGFEAGRASGRPDPALWGP